MVSVRVSNVGVICVIVGSYSLSHSAAASVSEKEQFNLIFWKK